MLNKKFWPWNLLEHCSFRIFIPILTVMFLLSVPGCSRSNVTIISAVYGSGTNYVDVSNQVYKMINLQMNFQARPEFLLVDPTPYHNKALVIDYEAGGRRHIFTALASDDDYINARVLLNSARNGAGSN